LEQRSVDDAASFFQQRHISGILKKSLMTSIFRKRRRARFAAPAGRLCWNKAGRFDDFLLSEAGSVVYEGERS
jgi:hypothetical protein